ncbi:MAG: hypothetical protein WD992_03365 [Candidatus Levyibacteriota bacterium]
MRHVEGNPVSSEQRESSKREQPKVFVFAGNEQIVSPIEELRFDFRVRTAADRIGPWGKSRKSLRIAKARETILTHKPDVIIFVNSLNDSDAADIMAQVPRRQDGTPLPMVIAAFTEPPSFWIRASRMIAEPFKDRNFEPGFLGTIMPDVEGVLVYSSISNRWKADYPDEEYKEIPEEPSDENTGEISSFLKEALERHKRPELEEWENKDRKTPFLLKVDHIFSKRRVKKKN